VPFLLSAGLATAPFLCLRSGPGPVGLAAPVAAGAADAEPASRGAGARARAAALPVGHVETLLVAAPAPPVPTTTGPPPTRPATRAAPPGPAPTRRAAPTRHVESATRAVPVATTAPAPAPSRQVVGKATWYDSAEGRCAANVVPLGTLLIVTSRATGASVTCRVVSRGPYGHGRVVDLARRTFARLAPPSAGVIEVVISW
jgi:rare lipoprotein A